MNEKSGLDDVQEKLSKALVDITEHRKQMPQKCIKILEENLKQEKLQSENIIVLPKGSKKLTSKYSADKSLDEIFNLPKPKIKANHLLPLISQQKENQDDLIKALQMCNKIDS